MTILAVLELGINSLQTLGLVHPPKTRVLLVLVAPGMRADTDGMLAGHQLQEVVALVSLSDLEEDAGTVEDSESTDSGNLITKHQATALFALKR